MLGTFRRFYPLLDHVSALSCEPRPARCGACCAMKTGCPLIGVCLTSFFGSRSAILVLMKPMACCRIVSIPLSWIYCRSSLESLNLDLNADFFRDARVREFGYPATFTVFYRIVVKESIPIYLDYTFSRFCIKPQGLIFRIISIGPLGLSFLCLNLLNVAK